MLATVVRLYADYITSRNLYGKEYIVKELWIAMCKAKTTLVVVVATASAACKKTHSKGTELCYKHTYLPYHTHMAPGPERTCEATF